MTVAVKVTIYPGGRVIEYVIRRGGSKVSVGKLLKDLGYTPLTAVIVKDGLPLTEDAVLRDGDAVELYEVRSAG